MADSLDNELVPTDAKRSLRAVAPLRIVERAARWFVTGAWAWLTLKPGCRPRRVAKTVVRRGIAVIEARPALKRRVASVARLLPGLYPALRQRYHLLAEQRASMTAEVSASRASGGSPSTEGLTPWARQMAMRLRAARAGSEARTK